MTQIATPAPPSPLPYPPEMRDAEVHIYRRIDGVELKLWAFAPAGHSTSNRRAAVVFFFGGGWAFGSPVQFERQCLHLASRGMVAITADYRVKDRHGVYATASVSDAREAVRWVRANAARLGVDPNRIAAGGGSAGGHLAATIATTQDPTGEGVSSEPSALVLFNPVTALAKVDGRYEPNAERQARMAERFIGDVEAYSPYHHVKPGMGPAILFHGKADNGVPFATAVLFRNAMREKGNRCDLVGYKDATHGFFNYGREANWAFADTVYRMDQFFVSIGYLEASSEAEVS